VIIKIDQEGLEMSLMSIDKCFQILK